MASPQDLEHFLAFSAELTAFTAFELRGTGQAEAYLETLENLVGPSVLADLLREFGLASTCGPAGSPQRLAYLRRQVFGNERLGPVARNLIKLWYVGTWYELPTAWRERYDVGGMAGDFVVSPAAYVEGLLWTAIGAHPAGAKGQGFGSWASPPSIPPF